MTGRERMMTGKRRVRNSIGTDKRRRYSPALIAMVVMIIIVNLEVMAGAKADFKTGWNAYQNGDFTRALKIWTPLAEKGDTRAQFNIGVMFAEGKGRAQSYKRAMQWWEKAAENGDAEAQHNIAMA